VAIYLFALSAWLRFWTNNSAALRWMKNLMTILYRDISDPCSGTMADLLASAVWAVRKRVCFSVCCHPISLTFADGRFERTIVKTVKWLTAGPINIR
jgi:hypothetical protein